MSPTESAAPTGTGWSTARTSASLEQVLAWYGPRSLVPKPAPASEPADVIEITSRVAVRAHGT